MKQLEIAIEAALIAVLLSLNGCTLDYSRQNIGVWDQHVSVTAWGIYYISPYGPVGLGYVEWARNIEPRTQLPALPVTPPSGVMSPTR